MLGQWLSMAYLIYTCLLHPEENGKVKVADNGSGYDVGDVNHDKLSAKDIELPHNPHQGNRRHERCHQREGNRHNGHVLVCQHVFLQTIITYQRQHTIMSFITCKFKKKSELDVDLRRDDDASPMSSYRCMLRPT